MVTDCHNHILFGVDDSAVFLEQSLELARLAVEMGYDEIYCTPHFMKGYYMADKATIKDNSEKLIEKCKEEGINLKFKLSREYYLDENIIESITQNGGVINKRVSIEGPLGVWPDYMDSLIYEIQLAGYVPVLAHPERNIILSENIKKLKSLKLKGCEIQLSLTSIIGNYGKRVESAFKNIVSEGLANHIASDMHFPALTGKWDDIKGALLKAQKSIVKDFGRDFWVSMSRGFEA